ncbi:unnamed protein product [Owenia fusiformis]|uniref:Lipocalin/cytosolic fatty-acid binding domain-containing protein n=1 Tax=Owenia fusiformis TaxID=6347 RepID=A0A8J1TN22_OWEFU|nr:unnamed protein product [Owenia fusiformis]CAH1802223.1 unnamed protein product [Owenia fusiformis]
MQTIKIVLIVLVLLAQLQGTAAFGPFFRRLLSRFITVTPVPELDLPKYLGRWYQMYTSPVVLNTFERDAVCVYAEYALRPDGKSISVFNANRVKVPTGPPKNITGYATLTDQPGYLMVKFPVAPVAAPYIVIKLGPVVNGEYQYSVVTDNFKASLFVLARDVQEFYAKYNAEVLPFLKAEGFTNFLNKPVKTNQDPTCIY